jgi:hypothetical protein
MIRSLWPGFRRWGYPRGYLGAGIGYPYYGLLAYPYPYWGGYYPMGYYGYPYY